MDIRTVFHPARPSLWALLLAFPCLGLGLAASPAFGQVGEWAAPIGGYDWPLGARHAAVLSTGKVLVWEFVGSSAKLWNPTDGLFTDVTTGSILYCAGHAFLTDGSLLVAGGLNTVETRIFRLSGPGGWEQAAKMAFGRFYPTCTALPDGGVLVVAGTGSNGDPEIYNALGNVWEGLGIPTPGIAEEYPFMFLLPDGKVFHAGGSDAISPPAVKTHTLDFQSTPPAWAEFPEPTNDSFFGGRKGAAVMYEPGKILKAGGVDPSGQPINKVARIEIDPNGPEVWEPLTSAQLDPARKDHHLVLLPDGKVLIVGGHDGTNFLDNTAMLDPQLQFPAWMPMADMVKARGHHSVAMLLPDATILSTGGNDGNPDYRTAAIYKPPYLFAGPPPVIASAPSSVQYGCQFLVSATPTAEIDRVTLVRPASVTHWFDSDQRFLELGFTVDAGELQVGAPCSGNFAPPGYYMMFVIDNLGVPSVATWIEFVPNACRADLNDDNVVDATDLGILLGEWGPCPTPPAFCLADLSCDGVVEAFDLAILLGAWGACGRGISSGTELINALVEMGYANVAEHTAWSTTAPTEDALASGEQLLELLGE